MQLSGKEDVEAPIAFVFEQVTDFSGFERQALRRGAEIRRKDTLQRPDVGAAWDVRFTYRGRERHLEPQIVAWEPPNGYAMRSAAGGLQIDGRLELLQLSRLRTRLTLQIDLAPQTLTARLLVQSLKLARHSLSKRLNGRIETYAREMEERYRRRQKARGQV